MPIGNRKWATMVLGLVVLATLSAFGADDPKTKVHKAGELSFEAPIAWKSEKPTSSMRKAQLKLAAAEGDTEPAELVVFVFPKGAGTVEANIKRWASQFKDGEGKAPEPMVKALKGKNVEVTRVEIAGRFVAPVTPGSSEVVDKPGFRLLGAIVQTDDAGYFFKMIGPDKTMTSAKSDFDALIASMSKGD